MRLIHSATRSLTYVIYVTAALVIFALLDLFGVLYHFQLYSEVQHDYVISVIALILLGVLFPLVWRVLKARRALDSWQEIFERGSLQMGISMSMTRRDKGEAIKAVAETVAELEPLRQHLASVGVSRFTDVSVGGVMFDGIVDESLVEADELKGLLREHGAIALDLKDVVDFAGVTNFHERMKTYSNNTGRRIGMAVIVASEVTDEARKGAGEVLLVEKANGD